jgi:hypothetical protein
MGNMPRSTRAWEIPTTGCNSHPASTTCSPLIPSTRASVLPSSADRSRPSGGCRPRFGSSDNIASHISRSVSGTQRRIWHSCNIWQMLVSCLDLELETHNWAKKSYWTALAQTRLASCSMRTIPRVCSKAANPSSHVATAPSLLYSSLSWARSCPYSSMTTKF